MGADPQDLGASGETLFLNYWHWRPIVEVIRRTGALPDARAAQLHDITYNNDFTKEEARKIAYALRHLVLPRLASDERLLLSGERTREPCNPGPLTPDGANIESWYSADKVVLEMFAAFCERCEGFRI